MKPSEAQIARAWERLVGPSASAVRVLPVRSWAEPEAQDLLARLRSEESGRYQQISLRSRRDEWLSGRQALLEVRAELEAREESGGRILTSLSHSDEIVLAVGVLLEAETGEHAPGVDLERAARAVSPRASSRILDPEERALGISALEAWSIKEACFKSDPRRNGAGRLVPEYRIVELDARAGAEQREGRVLTPAGGSIAFCRIATRDWIVALALS